MDDKKAFDFAALVLVAESHAAEHPDHGVNCACMDDLIRAVRKRTTSSDPRIQQRIDYVLRKATESRI